MIEKLKISDLQHPYTTNDLIFSNTINKIIDVLKEDECAQGCWTDLPAKHENQETEIRSRSSWQKKLEEADNFKIVYNEAGKYAKKAIVTIKRNYDIQQKLYKQVIEELIKDNENHLGYIEWLNDEIKRLKQLHKIKRGKK